MAHEMQDATMQVYIIINYALFLWFIIYTIYTYYRLKINRLQIILNC